MQRGVDIPDQLVHILHLEDDPANVDLVQTTLESAGTACEITCVQTHDEFGESLRRDGCDIILADYKLPMFDGISAMRMVRDSKPIVKGDFSCMVRKDPDEAI